MTPFARGISLLKILAVTLPRLTNDPELLLITANDEPDSTFNEGKEPVDIHAGE